MDCFVLLVGLFYQENVIMFYFQKVVIVKAIYTSEKNNDFQSKQ